ncbi:uncharacterized protein LOC135848789 [Planococcus citri]|uniref:uncharacterized protein LOC135848789 n=1 Tax=Planococcus citri TaxID=170843 RepID=UPI0031F93D6F
MEIFVQSQLINLRFFSNSSKKHRISDRVKIDNIRDRVDLVLEKIVFLKSISDVEKLDETFLFVARFIAQNIHVLKRQLKFTYDRLPWEEVEFCLVSFISSYVNQQEINFFYRAILNKSKIIRYLEQFAYKLETEKSNIENERVNNLADLPRRERDQIVTGIICNNPEFQDLYNDYQCIRDIHSLQKINEYLNLALSIDPKERRGQLIISRALQVMGEYLKNTLESPKLSSTTSELILLSLPENTRKIVIDLRNSLSHAYSLFRRSEIEENSDVSFFIGVQNNTKRIYDVITNILCDKKIKMIRKLLQDIVDSESLHEFVEIAEALSIFNVDKMSENSFKLTEHENLEKLINEMSDAISDKTYYEKNLFDQIREIMNAAKNESRNTISDYNLKFAMLKGLLCSLRINGGHSHNSNHVRIQKYIFKTTLQNFFPEETSSPSLKEIVELAMPIFHSVKSRLQGDDLQRLITSMFKIVHIAEFRINDIKWIKNLREKLHEKGAFSSACEENQPFQTSKEKYQKQLTLKLSELKTVLKDPVKGELNKKTLHWTDKKFQAAIEMLVLDILLILGESDNHLEETLLFLDEDSPLLLGKCLRNHLAHGNTLLDVLMSHSSTAIILNAEKLVSENIAKSNGKIGKLVKDDPTKLKAKFDQDLITVVNQGEMFTALEQGDFEELKNCIAKGADIRAKSINSWSALHFASRGPSLEVVKFILNQNLDANVINAEGQNPLHIAASNGRKNIVEFFITKAGISANSPDQFRRTPLHFAAKNGHKDVVKVLLQNNGDTSNVTDLSGFLPMHHAVQHNHVEVVKILLEKGRNVEHEVLAGFTPLHIAAENGRLEMVNFLLSCGANVSAKHDKRATPLHPAALNGHFEVVKALISKGADVNARALDGGTPLLHAVETGRQEIVNFLLKYGADPNIAVKLHCDTPLHYATSDGHEEIVEALLSYKADPNLVNADRISPLHISAQIGNLKMVTQLLKHGADVRAKAINFQTPLHCAAKSDREEIAQLLIQNGAEIDSKADDNSTPLHLAALKGHKDVAALLIKKKARINIENEAGQTPLFVAAGNGHVDICELLIAQNKSIVDFRNHRGLTSLHFAASGGHVNVINFLIKNGAYVNTRDESGFTPLHTAILRSNKNLVKFLIENGAMVDTSQSSEYSSLFHNTSVISPLFLAVEAGLEDIVEILIANGADVNGENGKPLLQAVQKNHKGILKILLQNKGTIDFKSDDGHSLLHIAAIMGHKDIVKVLIENGIDVNATSCFDITPLNLASRLGHEEIAEILIRNNANVNNIVNFDGSTPLHSAAVGGHANIIKLLLQNGAKMLKNGKNRSALEFAVAYRHLDVVKILLQHKTVNLNAKGNADWTILHIASQEDNLEIVKYLVSKGCNIHAKNSSGSKPIHIAAREGLKDIVEFFLSKGLKVDECGHKNQTLLHYAVMKNASEVVKFLISEGADINVKDNVGSTPLHTAALHFSADVIRVLLENGAVYNPVDNQSLKPLDVMNEANGVFDTSTGKFMETVKNEHLLNLFVSTENLFQAVKEENPSAVKSAIKLGAFINAKNAYTETTPLHYAAWKGCVQVIDILLENKANPNLVCSKKYTPLHYAAKFSKFKCVKALMCHGAIYNPVPDNGKIPLDYATDKDVINLLKVTDKCFELVKTSNTRVISILKKMKDSGTLKSIMNACNKDKKTLMAAAPQSNSAFVDRLMEVADGAGSDQIKEAITLLGKGRSQPDLSILNNLFNKRKRLLGPNNLATLDIQKLMAKAFYKQGNHQTALDMLENVFLKQKEMLGLKNKDTLETRSSIALILHRQGKNNKALDIFQDVYPKQKELLGSNHHETVDTQFHMALVLESLGKHAEALRINKEVFERRKNELGIDHISTVSAQNNIAMVLVSLGEYKESLKLYNDVFQKKKSLLGIGDAATLGTLSNIGVVYVKQNKLPEAVKVFQEVLSIQKKTLIQNHPETSKTQFNLAKALFAQGKDISAYKIYKECYDQWKSVFGPNHPRVILIEGMVKKFLLKCEMQGLNKFEIIQNLQTDINIAVCKGDLSTVELLLKCGADVNECDMDGRTPLHYAVNNERLDIVNILLDNGANFTHATNKGNTPLHTATSKRSTEIVNVLLQRISCDKLNEFVNAKTTSGGTTSLHVAAENGTLDIVKSLLNHGATYNVTNKAGKTPIDLSTNQKITNLLKLSAVSFVGDKRKD